MLKNLKEKWEKKSLEGKIKREKKSLERKINTYEALIETEKKKGAGPHNVSLLAYESHLRDCKKELSKLE